ncbi:MAG: PAS domain-containing protein [Methanomicrobiales archaeon]|nr:PAS domain-containing protein [Methanomicrobiales archaeon]
MEQPDELTQIKELLKRNPQGMSITEISRDLGKNMHSVGRYLDNLRLSGQVVMRTYGKAKVFSLARRVPLAHMMSCSREMILVLDRDLRVVQINDPFLSLLDLPAEEVTGRNLEHLPLPDPDAQDLLRNFTSRLREQGPDTRYHEHIRYGSGAGERFLGASVIPLVFDDGDPGYAILLVDITQEHRAHLAVEASEAQYRELVELAHAIILKMDRNGTITFFNEYAERFFGIPKARALGKPAGALIFHQENGGGVPLEDLIRNLCSGGSVPAGMETSHTTGDGRQVWVRWTHRAILDAGRNCTGILSVGSDITEHRRKDEELAASEARYRELASLLPVPVFESNVQGEFTFGNQEALLMFGYSNEDARSGIHILSMIAPEDRDRALRSMDLVLKEGKRTREEYVALRKDGSRFPILAFSAPLMKGGRIAGIRGIVIDRTEGLTGNGSPPAP